MKLVTALAATFLLAACSSSTSSPAGSDDAGGGLSSGGSSGGGSGSGSSSGGGSGSSSGSGSGGTITGGGDGGTSPTNGTDAGGGGGGTDAGKVPANDAKLVLSIPSTFTGTTREIDVVVVPSLPVAGPPAATLFQAKNPVITAGESLTVNGDTTGVNGSYYVLAVLYMQGGGTFSPSPGIDYEAQGSAKVTFNGGSIDLGTMALTVVQADGGP